YPNYAPNYSAPTTPTTTPPSEYPQGAALPTTIPEGTMATLPPLPAGIEEPIGGGAIAAADPAHAGLGNPMTFWFSLQAEAAFIRPWNLPGPLATTGASTDEHPGALGQPNTGILFGNRVDFLEFYGVHLDTGVYVDDE